MMYFRQALNKTDRRFHIFPTDHPGFFDFDTAKRRVNEFNQLLSPRDYKRRWKSPTPSVKSYYTRDAEINVTAIARDPDNWVITCMCSDESNLDEGISAWYEVSSLPQFGRNNLYEYAPEGLEAINIFIEYKEPPIDPELASLDFTKE
jgi:hypothetical protein